MSISLDYCPGCLSARARQERVCGCRCAVGLHAVYRSASVWLDYHTCNRAGRAYWQTPCGGAL